MSKIITNHVYPPIPMRCFDWNASREDYDEGDLVGHGETEQAAINDLLLQECENMICANNDLLNMYKENQIIVIYHGNCADGFGAAYGAMKLLGLEGVEYYPGVYQNDPPDVRGKHVIMVDFSYKPEVISQMLDNNCSSMLVIDHHKTAIEALSNFEPKYKHIDLSSFDGEINFYRFAENIFIDQMECSGARMYTYFDNDRSGAMMAWQFFNPSSQAPKLIEIIQDRDLWRFELPETRNVMAAIFSYPYHFIIWDELIGKEKQLELEGEAIERKHFKDIEELVKVCQRRMVIGGYPTLVASLPYIFSSDAGHIMADGEYFAACYWDTKDARIFSLRSHKEGIDVSEIAKQYGGGGHKNAAGFSVPKIGRAHV